MAPRASKAKQVSIHETVRIERLAAGGDGVGRLADGCTVFVGLTAPGDVARIHVYERHKRFAKAELVALETASDVRREPLCGVFGVCGGCDWQHLEYAAQVDAKANVIRDAISRIARLQVPDAFVFHASPEEFGYRSRARLLAKNGELGFRRRASHELCAVSSCPVLDPRLDALLRDTRPREKSGEVELVVGNRDSDEARDADAVEFAVGDDLLRVSAGAFAQANTHLHDVLVDAVLAAAGGGDSVCELYAGAGFFTLGLSRAFGRVLAVEVNARATADLAFNLGRAGRANVEVLTRPVDRSLGRVGRFAPEVIVLDPPRTGLDAGVAEKVAMLGARRIAYLSCDPATLARDLTSMAGRGYELVSLTGFDLFPQTAHVEALAVMERTA